MKEGWASLYGAKKWHYFRDRRSLCGKWIILTSLADEGTVKSLPTKSECKKCQEKLQIKEGK